MIVIGELFDSAEQRRLLCWNLEVEGLTFVFISHVSYQRLGLTDPSRRSACMAVSGPWSVARSVLNPCSRVQKPRDLQERINRINQEQRNGKSSYVKVFPENIQAQGFLIVTLPQ
jgi:hypothetical protein